MEDVFIQYGQHNFNATQVSKMKLSDFLSTDNLKGYFPAVNEDDTKRVLTDVYEKCCDATGTTPAKKDIQKPKPTTQE